jgi:hypothetical protein
VSSRTFGLLQQFQKFFIRVSRLLNDRLKGPAFQVAIVKRNGNSKGRLCWMLQDVMASSYVMNDEPSPLKNSDYFFWSNGWQALFHDLLTPVSFQLSSPKTKKARRPLRRDRAGFWSLADG